MCKGIANKAKEEKFSTTIRVIGVYIEKSNKRAGLLARKIR